MPKAENLTIVGKSFLAIESEKNIISRLKFIITNYMQKAGYSRTDITNPFFDDNFLCLKFMLDSRGFNLPLKLKLLKNLNLISKLKFDSELYFSWLRTRVDDVPFEVTFIITPSKYKEKDGATIEINSKPAILFKINQLGSKFPEEEFKYSKILATNKEFIYEIMKAFNSEVIDDPKVIVDYSDEIYKTPILKELEKFGFGRVSKILKEGLSKLKKGECKEAFDELRAVLEIFTKEIADRISNKNYPQDKINKNIEVLKDSNIINEEITDILLSIYYNKLYSYISDNISHKRKKLSIRDGEFLFSLIESYIKYILKKVIE